MDGYGAGPSQDIDETLGVGAGDLHEWFVPTRSFQQTDGTGGRVPAFDTEPVGMVVVRNSRPAEWADTNGWHLSPERNIRTADESDGALSNPSDIYVLDRGPTVIRHYSAEGAFLGLIGREGQGPGEFSDDGILYLVGDTLVHHDQSQAVSYWTADRIYRIAEDEAGIPGIEVWRVVESVN